MSKLSFGDLIINNQSNNQLANPDKGLSVDQMLKNLEKNKNLPDNTKSVIAMDTNPDGSIKYTFDNIYQNKNLVAVSRDYYKIRDGMDFESGEEGDKEAINKFIADRTFKQANSFSMGKEFKYITGKNVSQDQKARLSYLTRTWDELPNFYEEGGRGFSGFFANLGVGILDPINLVGAGVGGQVTKAALKKAGQEVIKSQIKGATSKAAKKTVAKELLNSPVQLSALAGTAKRNAILKGSASMAGVDAAGYGTIDIANQTVEK